MFPTDPSKKVRLKEEEDRMRISANEYKLHQVPTLQGGVHQSCNSYLWKSITNMALQAGIGMNLIIAKRRRGGGGGGGRLTFIDATCGSEHPEEQSTYIITRVGIIAHYTNHSF